MFARGEEVVWGSNFFRADAQFSDPKSGKRSGSKIELFIALLYPTMTHPSHTHEIPIQAMHVDAGLRVYLARKKLNCAGNEYTLLNGTSLAHSIKVTSSSSGSNLASWRSLGTEGLVTRGFQDFQDQDGMASPTVTLLLASMHVAVT